VDDPIAIADIQRAVSLAFKVPLIEMRSHRRGGGWLGRGHSNGRQLGAYERARMVAMYLSRELTGWSYPAIARLFDRDHTTVMHAVNRVEELASADADFGARVEDIRKKLCSEERVNGACSFARAGIQ
jgi:chromosomal replication initiator protein